VTHVRSYRCDWCKREKKQGERWLVGLAAERSTALGLRREVQIADVWLQHWAVDELAVHFCSEEHKENYVARFLAFRLSRRNRKKRSESPLVAPSQMGRLSRAKHARSFLAPAALPRNKSLSKGKKVFTPMDGIRARGMSITLEPTSTGSV
jgi:hypothetical protein